MKAEHRMGRNYLKGRDGDRINAVLAAAGYNFSLLLRWLERLLRVLMRMLFATQHQPKPPNERSLSVLHGRPFRRDGRIVTELPGADVRLAAQHPSLAPRTKGGGDP